MPQLDRLIEFDERSRSFALAPSGPIATGTWRLDTRLDQGREGACVGFGTSHRLAAAPVRVPRITDATAFSLYKRARQLDQWPGEDYEGTSVLAGMKAAQELGLITRYRWCFGIDDVLRAVSNEGPVVVGTWWKSDMWDVQPNGLITSVGGNRDGGHCYLIRGISLKPTGSLRGLGPLVRITNSWGRSWGVNGDAFLRVADMEALLLDDGEAVVPTETVR